MSFRVLLVYANLSMEPLLPLGVAMLATTLEDAGFEAAVFDTTLYPDKEYDDQLSRLLSGQIKPAESPPPGLECKTTDMREDFKAMVESFRPGLIGFSCTETTYSMAVSLLDAVRGSGIPSIMGGVFASFSPRTPLLEGGLDMVCVGEGEEVLVEVARRLQRGQDVEGTPNLWVRKGGKAIPPGRHCLANLADLPVPRFDHFEPQRIYRPMAGKYYRMLPLEISRGCPYRCTYCSAPAYRELFRPQGNWLRFKSTDRLMAEVDSYISRHDVEYLYLVSETFLAMPPADRADFLARIERTGLPYWFNTRPETVDPDEMKRVKQSGCHRVSVGIECGNETFRREVLNRNYSNDTVLRAVDSVMAAGVQLSVNNMIGFPDETLAGILDTIELNRRFTCDSHSLSIFHPFRGTRLHTLSVAKGYWPENAICEGNFAEPKLEMPSISRQQVKDLYQKFNTYRSMPESEWLAARSELAGNGANKRESQ